MILRCLAVDDERLALDLLEDNISKVPYLEIAGRCKNAFEVIEQMQHQQIDLLFLDIQMPGLSGVEFVRTLNEQKPLIIFVTAYEQYALQGYELSIVDYLLKPVPLERFIQACNKAKEIFLLKAQASKNLEPIQYEMKDDSFFVNSEYSLIKIENQHITHIESMKDYIKIFLSTQPKPVITRMTMKAVEEKLPMHFFRCHKSFIVNLQKVQSLRNSEVFIDKFKIPYSDNLREELMQRLGIA